MFASWTTDKKTVNTESDLHFDLGSPSTIFSPKYLKAAHQTEAGPGLAIKAKINGIFDHVDVRKHFV